MNLIQKGTPDKTVVPWHPIVAGVIHDTEGHAEVDPTANGSFHFEIDRDGQVYQFGAIKSAIMWHVRAADRWRPAWVQTSPYQVSDVNYCTVGIEMVSDAAYRLAGTSYTDAQYAALAELVTWIEAQTGALWWVGHGELQSDRSDPVLFDWIRAGFGEREADGRRFVGVGSTSTVEEDETMIAELQAKVDELTSTNSAQRDQIAALHSEVTQLRDEVIPALEAQVQAASAPADFSSVVSDLKARIDAILDTAAVPAAA